MKLKYYLRGLGLGILVTFLLMFNLKKDSSMTDEEIIKRAKELGYIESQVLTNISNESETGTELESEVESEIETELESEVESETGTELESEVESEIETELDSKVESWKETESNQEDETYFIVTVSSGDGSETVSRKLFEQGVIESIEEYNRFLIKNGYDKKIRVGQHEIPKGASDLEIAEIITSRKIN
ncbi:MAG: hypothetical protein ACRC7V_03880 [Lachnospiraceae bacterium]